MKEKLAPPEKKRLSYKKDHRTRTGEDERAMRRAWASRKKRLNRNLRRRADAVIRKATTPDRIDSLLSGDDGTTNELIRKGLARETNSGKWGVHTLGEFVERRTAKRIEPRETNRQRRERIAGAYRKQIIALETDPDSAEAVRFLGTIRVSSSDLWGFLRVHPEWKKRLRTKLNQLKRIEDKKAAEAKTKAEEKFKWRSPSLRHPRETK